MTGAAIGHLKAAECLIILISDSSAVPLEVHIAEKYHYPRQVYVARDPGCCEVVSGASCPSRGKCSSGPSIHQKPAIWRLWVGHFFAPSRHATNAFFPLAVVWVWDCGDSVLSTLKLKASRT